MRSGRGRGSHGVARQAMHAHLERRRQLHLCGRTTRRPAVDALRLSTDTLTSTLLPGAGWRRTSGASLITIHGNNDAPVASRHVGSADEAGVVVGSNATGNVLANDTDVDAGAEDRGRGHGSAWQPRHAYRRRQ